MEAGQQQQQQLHISSNTSANIDFLRQLAVLAYQQRQRWREKQKKGGGSVNQQRGMGRRRNTKRHSISSPLSSAPTTTTTTSASIPQLLQTMIRDATGAQLLAVVECCYNVLKARVPLMPAQKRQLRRLANEIRAISRVRSPKSAVRLLNPQRGRGLPVLAAGTIVSMLMPIISDYINKQINNICFFIIITF